MNKSNSEGEAPAGAPPADPREWTLNPLADGSPEHALEMYRIFREYVVHENDLINHRMSWFVTLNSFLFASVALIIGIENKPAFIEEWSIFAFVAAVSAVGFFASVATNWSVVAAFDALKSVRDLWVWKYEPRDLGNNGKGPKPTRIDADQVFPHIKGGGPGLGISKRGARAWKFSTLLVSAIWAVIFCYAVWRLISSFPVATG